jgi:hypothetical protein
MTLSASVTKHHTVRIRFADGTGYAARYAVDGDRMVCFGDVLPPIAADGTRVFLAVHEIAGGPALAEMAATLRDVAADEIDPNAVLDLLEHVSLGRSMDEVNAAIARHRRRRLVAFEISG